MENYLSSLWLIMLKLSRCDVKALKISLKKQTDCYHSAAVASLQLM